LAPDDEDLKKIVGNLIVIIILLTHTEISLKLLV
jgi:hypothetical protein